MIYASGYLLYVRQSVLTAQRFDPSDLQFSGDPVPIADNIASWPERAKGNFSASQNGLLVYQLIQESHNDFYEVGRNSSFIKLSALPLANDAYGGVSVSPDWQRILLGHHDQRTGNHDVWSFDLVRNMNTRLTFDEKPDFGPIWSPDGKSFVFVRGSWGAETLFFIRKQADGAGAEEEVFRTDRYYGALPTDWTRDGKYLVVMAFNSKLGGDVLIVPLDGKKEPITFAATEFNERNGKVSPDGRWIAYTSDETGVNQLYVRPFLGKEGKWQLSNNPVEEVFWSKAGRELVYRSGGQVFGVDIAAHGPSLGYGVPRRVLDLSNFGTTALLQDVSSNGDRFLINSIPSGSDALEPVHLIANWQAPLMQQEQTGK
jgi:serine/threonine-protein kinase